MAHSQNPPVFTLAEARTIGQPIADPSNSTVLPARFGGGSLALLQDTLLIETLAHFNRERIPERVVHARAAAAWGEFEVTHDISHLTTAKFLNGIGKKTKVLQRISTVGGATGSAETVRDVRGFSVKFFTEEGNHDIVGNDIPVFFVRDPVKFPSLNRSHKKNPRSNTADETMFWDFHVNNQEGVHALMHLFGSRGIPASLRNINGFGVHTYKLVAVDGSFKYCKFHFKPIGGVQNMSPEDAAKNAGENADYHTADLFNAIENGDYPVWTLYVQVMEPKVAETYPVNIFDITKTWPHKDFPLLPVGNMTLNKNPHNYFEDVEQAAFSPSNMVPGISVTPDPMLQARMFAYPDAQRYRLGVNYQQLASNRALSRVYTPYERDGAASFNGNYGGEPNYVRSDFTVAKPGQKSIEHDEWAGGKVGIHEIPVSDADFAQATELWNIFGTQPGEQEGFVKNVAGAIQDIPKKLQEGTIAMFSKVHPDIGRKLQAELNSAGKISASAQSQESARSYQLIFDVQVSQDRTGIFVAARPLTPIGIVSGERCGGPRASLPAPTVFTGRPLRGTLVISHDKRQEDVFDVVQLTLQGEVQSIIRLSSGSYCKIKKPLILMSSVKVANEFEQIDAEDPHTVTYQTEFFFDIPDFTTLPSSHGNNTPKRLPPSMRVVKSDFISAATAEIHNSGSIAGTCDVTYKIAACVFAGGRLKSDASREIILMPIEDKPPPLEPEDFGKEYRLVGATSLRPSWGLRKSLMVVVSSMEPRPLTFSNREEGCESTEVLLHLKTEGLSDGNKSRSSDVFFSGRAKGSYVNGRGTAISVGCVEEDKVRNK
ncbi:hypothetical protein V501_06856 [Pseudogymnoascus sp. VKM F-4519 (FW-2642)]|nr:hypothetical protein V501_06856 [Pseudogymnoascus sp. VKM F-4519 (FW-2642)]